MDSKNSENEGLLVEDSNVSTHVMGFMNELRKNGEYCDFVIVIEDVEFPCHKGVLSAMSSYFNTLFRNSFKESNDNRIVIHSHTSATFDCLLQYMYTGKVKYKHSEIASGFEASVFYGIDSLTRILAEYMKENITQDTVLDWFFAIEHCSTLSELRNSVVQYIKDNFCSLAQTAKFFEIPFDLFLKLVTSDNINVTKEEEVFEAIEHWIMVDKEKRMQHAPELLKGVRFDHFSQSFLIKVMLKTEKVGDVAAIACEILKDVQDKPSLKRRVDGKKKGENHVDGKKKGENAYILYHQDAPGIKPFLFDGESICSLNWMYEPLHKSRPYYWLFSALSKEAVYVYFQFDKELICLYTTESRGWRPLSTSPSMIESRRGQVCDMAYFQENNSLYFLLKYDSSYFPYDCQTGCWSSYEASFLERGHFMLRSDQSGLFALNREVSHSWAGYRRVLHFLDPRIGNWTELSPFVSQSNDKLMDYTVINGKIYALVGDEIIIYDRTANRWNMTGKSLGVPVSHLFSFNNHFVALGKETGSDDDADDYLYSFNIDQISKVDTYKKFYIEPYSPKSYSSFCLAAL